MYMLSCSMQVNTLSGWIVLSDEWPFIFNVVPCLEILWLDDIAWFYVYLWISGFGWISYGMFTSITGHFINPPQSSVTVRCSVDRCANQSNIHTWACLWSCKIISWTDAITICKLSFKLPRYWKDMAVCYSTDLSVSKQNTHVELGFCVRSVLVINSSDN